MSESVSGIGSTDRAGGVNLEELQRRKPEEDGTASLTHKKPEEDIHTKSRQVAFVNPSGSPSAFGFGFPQGGTAATASQGRREDLV